MNQYEKILKESFENYVNRTEPIAMIEKNVKQFCEAVTNTTDSLLHVKVYEKLEGSQYFFEVALDCPWQFPRQLFSITYSVRNCSISCSCFSFFDPKKVEWYSTESELQDGLTRILENSFFLEELSAWMYIARKRATSNKSSGRHDE